jgi:tetratricopeptide (TPR) repeat protein
LARHEAALESYTKAISLDPGFADWYASRGKMLADLKQYRAALADFDAAISAQVRGEDFGRIAIVRQDAHLRLERQGRGHCCC